MKRYLGLVAAAMVFGGTIAAEAQETCGGQYRVQPGDSLSGIADRLYKDAGQWTVIFRNNSGVISSPNAIQVGQVYNMPCINGLPTGLEGGVAVSSIQASAAAAAPRQVVPGNAATRHKINLLTATDYAPFTDSDLPNGGLLTDVVEHAMAAANPEDGYAIHFVNDWSSHFEPLLSNALLDLGFPWNQPDCESDPETYRCQNLDFSDSMFELLTVMFVRQDDNFAFFNNESMQGRTICRPKGYSVFLFDEDGRNWIKDGVIKHEAPGTPADCMEMLMAGEVDGVALDEFAGRTLISEMGIGDEVKVSLGQPISIDTLHIVVHKSHPRGEEFLAVFEDGLKQIKENGTYQRVVDQHMTRIWAEF